MHVGTICLHGTHMVLTILPMSASHDVEIFENRVTEQQIRSALPAYVNALLLQFRGIINTIACNLCRTRENRGPLVQCVSLENEWNGCCANCKWRNHGARCSDHSYGLPAVEGSSRVKEVEEDEE
jgi:hypothetical protein